MKVKVFDKNSNGKIEFTRKELEALLNEVYNDGYKEGRDSKYYTWTSPTITYSGNQRDINSSGWNDSITYSPKITCDTSEVSTSNHSYSYVSDLADKLFNDVLN